MLTIDRHDSLRSICDFLHKSLQSITEEKDINVSNEMINYLGLDAFPLYLKEAMMSRKKQRADELLKIKSQPQLHLPEESYISSGTLLNLGNMCD